MFVYRLRNHIVIGLPFHQLSWTKLALMREDNALRPPRVDGFGEVLTALFKRLCERVDLLLQVPHIGLAVQVV